MRRRAGDIDQMVVPLLPVARGACSAIACTIIGTILTIAPAPAAAEWRTIPFAGLRQDERPGPVEAHADGRRFRIPGRGMTAGLPEGVIPQAVLPNGPGESIVIGRRALTGELTVVDPGRQGRAPHENTLRPDLAGRLLLFHAFPALGANIVVAYDVQETFASGRSGGVVRDGMDIFRLDVAGGAATLTKLVDKSPIAGVDSAVRDIAFPGGHIVCGQSSCLRLKRDGDRVAADGEPIRPKGWAGFAQVELFLRDGEPRALLRRDDDDRFTPPPEPGSVTYRDCPALRDEGCVDLPTDRLPSGVDAKGTIQYVAACDHLAGLIERDLSRLPNGGLTFLGMNNHEGRLPWGQVYVLDGLLDVAEGKALAGSRFDPLRRRMLDRVAMEVVQWSRLAETERPWLWSRRYSVERRDIVSVVHLGRMARVASRLLALRPEVAASLEALLGNLHRELGGLERTIEMAGARELLFRRGADFWFDGGNAAWNVQNSWVEGVAALEGIGRDMAPSRALARALIEEFISDEITPKRPDTWRYCGGPCQAGWSAADGVSTNTPNWEGNKTRTDAAHASYRAMDVRAVLDAARAWKLEGLQWFPAHARDLVERGWLYPLVAAPLAEHGVTPRLHSALVGRYGRSAIPFDIHNQIWALDQIARDIGCGARR